MSFLDHFAGQITPAQYLDFFIRIIVACICGAAIGFERSKRLKNAGLRTHIMVCCASALMMIVSKYGFADLVSAAGGYLNGTNGTDPARIAAQVVSGISFLGAGVIFKHGASIKGLTTAAGIWATAGIGLAIGSGMYILGILTTAVVAVIQIIMHRHTIGGDSTTLSRMRCTTSEPKVFRKQLDEYLEANGIQITDVKIERNENGSTTYELELRIGREMTISDVTGFLEAMDGVQKISFEMEG